MDILTAARKLCQLLEDNSNFQSVGIQRIEEDTLIVYTFTTPTKEEEKLISFEGYKVKWQEMGKLTL